MVLSDDRVDQHLPRTLRQGHVGHRLGVHRWRTLAHLPGPCGLLFRLRLTPRLLVCHVLPLPFHQLGDQERLVLQKLLADGVGWTPLQVPTTPLFNLVDVRREVGGHLGGAGRVVHRPERLRPFLDVQEALDSLEHRRHRHVLVQAASHRHQQELPLLFSPFRCAGRGAGLADTKVAVLLAVCDQAGVPTHPAARFVDLGPDFVRRDVALLCDH